MNKFLRNYIKKQRLLKILDNFEKDKKTIQANEKNHIKFWKLISVFFKNIYYRHEFKIDITFLKD